MDTHTDCHWSPSCSCCSLLLSYRSTAADMVEMAAASGCQCPCYSSSMRSERRHHDHKSCVLCCCSWPYHKKNKLHHLSALSFASLVVRDTTDMPRSPNAVILVNTTIDTAVLYQVRSNLARHFWAGTCGWVSPICELGCPPPVPTQMPQTFIYHVIYANLVPGMIHIRIRTPV